MPNYVKNILSFDGDPAQVGRLFSAIQGENGPMDFNKLIPMPAELESRSRFAHHRGLQEIYGFLAVTGLHTEMEPAYHRPPGNRPGRVGMGKAGISQSTGFWMPHLVRVAHSELGYQMERQQRGSLGWPAFFLTAWNAPKPVMEKLSGMFPTVSIHHAWADEDIGHNCGGVHLPKWGCDPGVPPTGHEAIELGYPV